MWIVTTLFKIINCSEMKTIEYQIAYKILENLFLIENMSVQDLAEKCNVSVSSLNKFLKIFGFYNFTFFKSIFVPHIDMRFEQLTIRMRDKDIEKENAILKTFLNHEDYIKVTDDHNINLICQQISQSKRVMLIGSDEMKTMCLRFQGDFAVMNKLVIQNSLYEGLFDEPNKEDLVFIFSMTGRTLLINKALINVLNKNKSNIITCGHDDYLENNHLLYIPKGLTQYLEDMIFIYYLEKIIMKYKELYYVDR